MAKTYIYVEMTPDDCETLLAHARAHYATLTDEHQRAAVLRTMQAMEYATTDHAINNRTQADRRKASGSD